MNIALTQPPPPAAQLQLSQTTRSHCSHERRRSSQPRRRKHNSRSRHNAVLSSNNSNLAKCGYNGPGTPYFSGREMRQEEQVPSYRVVRAAVPARLSLALPLAAPPLPPPPPPQIQKQTRFSLAHARGRYTGIVGGAPWS